MELQCTQSKNVNAVRQLLHQLQGRLIYEALRSHVHQQNHLLLRRLQVKEGGTASWFVY